MWSQKSAGGLTNTLVLNSSIHLLTACVLFCNVNVRPPVQAEAPEAGQSTFCVLHAEGGVSSGLKAVHAHRQMMP